LRAAFRKTRATLPFHIDAIVVLPDHLHVVMTLPDGDSNFPARWRRVKGLFTRGVLGTNSDAGQLWQPRYWEHTIKDDNDFERHVDYTHYNPVKHRLVARVADWRYSSFHRYVRQGLLPLDWAGKASLDVGAFGEP
jgi:putative transposase